MCVIDGTGVRKAVHVLVSAVGDDDLGYRVIKIVLGYSIARGAVGLGFVPPKNDHSMILVGVRCHDHGNDLAQEVVSLFDVWGIAGQPFVASAERGVHVVVLVRRDPVVIGHLAIGQI